MKAFLDQFKPEIILPHFEKVVRENFDFSPCNVLHLATGNLFGGVETTLINMFRHRALMPEISLSFALMFPGRLRNELQALGAPIVDLGPLRRRYPWQVWRAQRILLKHFTANRPRLVITHSCWTHSIFSGVAKKAGVPCALWLHDRPKGPGKNRSWSEFLASKNQPDILICNSRYTAGGTRGLYLGIPSGVVYPVTDLAVNPDLVNLRNKLRSQIGCPARRRVVLMTSRFDPYKGHLALVDALGRLGIEGDWECWIANEPQTPAEHNLKGIIVERAQSLGIGFKLRWLGHRSDVIDLYAAADVFCQPNQDSEPFGQVFIEAQAMGCPVITYGMGGALEAVNPCAPNVLLDPGDSAGLCSALKSFLFSEIKASDS